jgi:general secretion pathway protein K
VPRRPHISPRARTRGVALVAVLLLIAGLIAIATAIVTLSVSQRRAAQRAYEADVRREMLDGALRVALAEIANAKPNGPFWHPRAPRVVSIGGKHVEVNLERESGRIDLNTADPKYLVAALVVMGRSEVEARAGAARIRDWIDADDEAGRDGGAERREYQAAHLTYEPRNGPFESVEELRQVLGLQDLTDQQLDSFTVYSQQLEPYAAEAPTAVRDALAWLAKSAGEGGANASLPPVPVANSSEPVSYAGSVIRLRACLAEEREAPCRVTVQRITGSLRQPFQVFLWR